MLYTLSFCPCYSGAFLGKSVLFDKDQVGDSILAVSGHIPKMFERAWRSNSLKQRLILPDDLAQRQVEGLSNYPYMEDGLLIWQALHEYMQGCIKVYYQSDEALLNDSYIQAWLEQLHQLLPHSDLPQRFDSIEVLVLWITGMVFNGAAMHASMNGQMFNHLAFVPGSLHLMQGPFPTQKDTLTYQALIEMLPDAICTEITIDTMAFLGNRYIDGVIDTDESTLMDFELRSSNQQMRQCYVQLQRQLADIEAQITRRNQSRQTPYEVLMPSKITASASW